VLVFVDDASLRARLEHDLAASPAPAIVTADLASIASLRAAHPRTPIVVIGIRRGAIAAALDAGADAALAGAPRPGELRARLRAIARRRDPPLRVGPLELLPWARSARIDGVRVELTAREFDVLWCLASAAGQVVTKDQLLRRCWGASAPDPVGRALERCLTRVRLRLGGHAPLLVTVWGIGYRLGEPDWSQADLEPR
jgi:DNA-binding response OmpR family regulator